MFDDAGHEIRTWVIDTAADFGKGTSLVDVGIDPWGSLTPAGYFYGGLTISGVDNTVLWHTGDMMWSFASTAGVTPTASARWNGQDIDSGVGPGADSPTTYFGVSHTNSFSAWVYGEVNLPAGASQFRLSAGDIAFLEIAEPHSDQFQQIIVAKGGAQTAGYTAMAAGWHPIRIGWSNSSQAFSLSLEYALGSGPLGPLPRTTMRGRAEGPRGLMQYVFDHQILTATVDGTVHPRPQIAAMDAIGPTTFQPLPDGAPNNTSWSGRWTGQFYADMPGMYTLEVDSSDGNQLAVAGTGSGSNFATGEMGDSTSTVTATLAQGWNDLTVDINKVQNTASLTLKVTAAPDPNLVGKAIALDHLRAVEPVADRLTCGTDGQMHAIPNKGTGTASIPFTGFTGETVSGLAMRLDFTNPEWQGLTFTITNPRNDKIQLNGGLNGSGELVLESQRDATSDPAFFQNLPVGTNPWKVAVDDSVDTMMGRGGQINELDLVLHLANGPQPIATDPVWTSELIDNMTTVASFDSVTWMSRDLAGAAVVRLRTCDAPCTNEAWTAVQNGQPPPASLAGKRYLQAQVEMTSDGVHAPEFEQLQVVYRRNLM